jgi:glycosyltransferase involved in cell wall biosynthesis
MNSTVTPLVSVVIPTYNHARFIGRALQSVLNQTYTNWEAIVIDNHSTDNTDEVLANFTDPRISNIKIHNNGVIAASRNAGIRVAKGEWVAFLDSDDWWTADKLQVCFESINNGNVDLVYHDLEIVRDTPAMFKRKKTKSRQVKKPVLKDLLLKGNTIATSSVVVRKRLLEQIGGMDEDVQMIAAEDYNAWLRIARITDNFIYTSRCLGFYFFHVGGASRKSIGDLLHYVCKEFVPLLEPKEKLVYQAAQNYISALNDYYSCQNTVVRKTLLYGVRNGLPAIKIKSLLLYCVLSLQFPRNV